MYETAIANPYPHEYVTLLLWDCYSLGLCLVQGILLLIVKHVGTYGVLCTLFLWRSQSMHASVAHTSALSREVATSKSKFPPGNRASVKSCRSATGTNNLCSRRVLGLKGYGTTPGWSVVMMWGRKFEWSSCWVINNKCFNMYGGYKSLLLRSNSIRHPKPTVHCLLFRLTTIRRTPSQSTSTAVPVQKWNKDKNAWSNNMAYGVPMSHYYCVIAFWIPKYVLWTWSVDWLPVFQLSHIAPCSHWFEHNTFQRGTHKRENALTSLPPVFGLHTYWGSS